MSQTMTIKQIAELCNVSPRTVQRWVVEIKDNSSSISDKMSSIKKGHPAEFELNEIISIVKDGGKNETLASLLKENATENLKVVSKNGNSVEKVLDLLIDQNKMLFEQNQIIIKALFPNGNPQLPNEKNQSSLPKPEIKINPRDKFRELINDYCKKTGENYQDAYNKAYQALYFHLHTNVKLQAKNRNKKPIDILDELGRWDEIFSLMESILNAG